MPSKYQSDSGSYDSEPERFLSVDVDVEPLIRGIEDTDRILLWWNYICTEGIEGDVREQVKERMEYLHNREQ